MGSRWNDDRGFVAALLLLLAMTVAAQAGQREAAAKVRAGIDRFSAGDFKAASEAFAEAEAAKPDDAWIAFDRAAAQAAQGEVDKAAELLRQASLSRNARLAALSHYNLGCLAAGKARALFGERPQEALPDVRKQGLGLLAEAVGHYRDCLRVDADQADARYNLETIRLWIKHMQAAWEEHDRQKQRKEMGLLEFLEMLQTRQRLLRATSRLLSAEPDSPRRRQAVVTATTGQRSLADEIGPLKDKIREEVEKATQAGSPQATSPAPGVKPPAPTRNADAERAIQALSEIADQAGQAMHDAADRLNDGAPADAMKPQEKAVEQLDRLQISLLPFPGLLQKAIGRQRVLIDLVAPAAPPSTTPPSSASSPATPDKQEKVARGNKKAKEPNEPKGKEEKPSETGSLATAAQPAPSPARPTRAEQVDLTDAAWEQGFLPGWSDALAAKARHGLKDLEGAVPPVPDAKSGQSTAAGQAGSPGNVASQPAASQPDAEKVKKQYEAMKRTFEKAVELCPQVRTLTADAAAALKQQKAAVAIPKQQKAWELLREIAEQMPKEDQKDQKQQEKQGQKDQKQQEKQGQKQDKKSPQREPQQQKSESQQQQERQKDASRDQAEATLRKARQRERERQELEKQLMEGLYRPVPVEKDW